jgi:hypothetical protein
MTPTKLNRAPLTKRISALAITAAAALTFAAFSPSAHAATIPKEFQALANALVALFPGQNLTVSTANPIQLRAAVARAIVDQPKLKPGNIAGEALKGAGSNGADAGDEIAAALRDAANTPDDFLAARDAIKRAGSGKNLNVALVPDFAAVLVASDLQAIELAKKVISTKPGAGAVIGGRASELATLAEQTNLTNQALAKSSKLTAAAQDITKYVVETIIGGDSAAFTNSIAGNPANVTLAAKIGTGGVAGDPTNGGDIVDTLLKNTSLPKLKSGIVSFAKSVGKVADIEEISKIAIAVGTQVGTVDTAKPTTTAIKFSNANGVVKSLAQAIAAKATTSTSVTDPNSAKNKQDEIAEVAAYMVAKILNPLAYGLSGGTKAQVTSKNVASKIVAIVLSAVNATKPKKVQTANPGIYLETSEDVAGSVAETLSSLRAQVGQTIPAGDFQKIIDLLLKKATAIGGKAGAGAVTTAINAGWEATGPSLVDGAYEDGTILANALTSDYPETDFRPN